MTTPQPVPTTDAPSAITGRRVVEVSSKVGSGVDVRRWHEIAVYQTVRGRYAVAIRHRTISKGETAADIVTVVADGAELRDFLRRYDPLARVGPESTQPLVAMVRERWDALVTQTLEAVDAEAGGPFADPGRR